MRAPAADGGPVGKTGMEAIRALKRRLSDIVYRRLVDDQKRLRQAANAAGPGGHSGAATGSSAADSNPNVDASEKSLPGPAGTDPTPGTAGPPHRAPARSRRPVNAPTGEDRRTLDRREQPTLATEGSHVRKVPAGR